ncbi:hypothetical protein F7725_005178, partial [Dissostichus mawsoni]
MKSNPKGEEIFKEYDKTKTLSDATRRQMINILVAEMTESYGPNFKDGPTTERESLLIGEQLFGEECREALSIIRHSTDKAVVKDKMRATFEYRQKLIHDQDATSSVLDVFHRFLDIPEL